MRRSLSSSGAGSFLGAGSPAPWEKKTQKVKKLILTRRNQEETKRARARRLSSPPQGLLSPLDLDGVLAPRERRGLLRGLDRLGLLLVLGQTLPDRARLLRAQVQREVLGPGKLGPDRAAALLRDDGQHARDALADRLDLGELVGSAAGDLGDAERSELLLEVLELFFFGGSFVWFCFRFRL